MLDFVGADLQDSQGIAVIGQQFYRFWGDESTTYLPIRPGDLRIRDWGHPRFNTVAGEAGVLRFEKKGFWVWVNDRADYHMVEVKDRGGRKVSQRQVVWAEIVEKYGQPVEHPLTLQTVATTTLVEWGTADLAKNVQAAIRAALSLRGDETVNLNTATVEDLQGVPGIGWAKAQDIIACREENGPFATLAAVAKVRGFGPATVKSLETVCSV